VVFSDLGRAASFMALAWVQASLKESLGFAPYPGTLNVRVETDQGRELWRAVQSQGRGIEISAPDAAYCQARCFLVRIEGKHQGAVLLPEVEAYPEDKLEVVAPVRLKDELKLADGQRITLEFVD
jgi:CTP-dependent riboflavin kinase